MEVMAMVDQATKELAEAVWKLGKAVEQLAHKAGDNQAETWARQAKRIGNQNR
jgi:hypothetical protein